MKNLAYPVALTLVATIGLTLSVQSIASSQSIAGTGTRAVELPAIAEKEIYARQTLGAEEIDIGKETNDILYRYGRLERIEKGIWLAPDVPLPPCDESVRGLLWFLKGEKGDGLLVCVMTGSGALEWQSL